MTYNTDPQLLDYEILEQCLSYVNQTLSHEKLQQFKDYSELMKKFNTIIACFHAVLFITILVYLT